VGAYVPASQTSQVVRNSKPTFEEKKPAAHSSHDVWPIRFVALPDSHTLHCTPPVEEYLPAAQSTQAGDAEVGACLPGPHDTQLVRSSLDSWPASQALQLGWPLTEILPASHEAQSVGSLWASMRADRDSPSEDMSAR
jgi:hypothetical protein